LHHTNIVPVFGVGEHEGLPYYVMQFIQGLGLDLVLKEVKRLQGATTGSAPGLSSGEPRVSLRDDLSAADFARPLLTGHYAHAAGGDVPAPMGAATVDHPPDEAAEEAAPAETPAAGRAPGTSSASGSSVVLPGAALRPGKKQLSYWQSVARVGEQV